MAQMSRPGRKAPVFASRGLGFPNRPVQTVGMDDAPYGRIERAGPLVRRLLAPNPSAFTYTGTQTYFVGDGEVAVIDPGPDLPEHLDAILAALSGERVTAILVTHNHRDHSPAARPLQDATGAPILGGPSLAIEDDGPRADAAFDRNYRPDRIMADGEALAGPSWTLRALATPGHASNHLCFELPEAGALFSGDHVMGWSTTVVAPPDGDMAAYRASLERLRERRDLVYYPAHGPVIDDPQAHLDRLIAHRRMREAQILAFLERGEGGLGTIVAAMYPDLDSRLHAAAGRSVLAHLIELEQKGLAHRHSNEWREGVAH